MAEYKLGYTGAQIDTAIGRVMDGVPHNLLDNSWFANPVNQRGASSYKGSTYCFDRWYFYSADATDSQVYKRDGNIGLKGGASAASISQRFPKGYLDSSKSYTLAYYDNINDKLTVKSNPVYFSRDDFDYLNIAVTTGAATFIQWAALYEGSYTADTLPAYVPKGYAAELAECLRNCKKLSAYGMYRASIINTNTIEIMIPLSVPMRIKPSIASGTMQIWTTASGVVDGFTFSVSSSGNDYLRISAAKTGHGLTDAVLRIQTDTIFSSDL